MVIAFIIILIIALTYAMLIMPRVTLRPDMSDLLTDYAHRGFFDNDDGVPENSLEAFKYAVLGGFGIELDLQLTKDGKVVVFHDYTLKRMCGRDVKLSSLTLDELRSFNLLGTAYKIPTFKEVLDLVDGRVPLLIELKGESGNTALCPAVDALLDNYRGAYSVESFNPLLLRWYKINRPEVVRGQLVTNLIRDKKGGNFVRNLALSALFTNCLSRPDFIAADQRFLRGLSIRLCTQLFGARLFVWTVRKKEHFDINRENGDLSIFEGFDPTA
jgi:glycerophosphoryl diester phosphodiesterase